MLPDFPQAKNELMQVLTERMKLIQSGFMQPFGELPKFVMHEGDSFRIIRADGSIDEVPMKEAKVKITIEHSEVETMTPAEIIQRVDSMAEEMARQQSQIFFKKINETTAAVGNTIDVGGGELTVDDYLDMLSKVQFNFDENGEPKLPVAVTGEKLHEAMVKIQEQLRTDAAAKARFDEIIRQEKEEWRVRESNRKLVG
ncbi:MAG: hypothetical protein KGZ93_10350 [Actinobacteria bacterium]|nr:hypothetical protein [Actinomycetota bacterium]